MQMDIARICNICIFCIQMEHQLNEISTIVHAFNRICNTFIHVATIIFIWALQVGCVNKSNGSAIPTFFHLNIMMSKWAVSPTNNWASRYNWVVFGRYLPLKLIGKKMKVQLLFDASNAFIQVVVIIFILALQMACVNKSNGNAIPTFFSLEHYDAQMGGCLY